MVYKIRNKSFFWVRAGWKNNWHPKNFNAPRPTNSEVTMGIRCRYDHHSFLRGKYIILTIKQLTLIENYLDIANNIFMAIKH